MGTWSPLPLHCCLEGVISLETENLPSSLVGVVLGGNKVMRIFESWILKNDLFLKNQDRISHYVALAAPGTCYVDQAASCLLLPLLPKCWV